MRYVIELSQFLRIFIPILDQIPPRQKMDSFIIIQMKESTRDSWVQEQSFSVGKHTT